MKLRSNVKRRDVSQDETEKLMVAHHEIIDAWFNHWVAKEQSRIDHSFEKPKLTSQTPSRRTT